MLHIALCGNGWNEECEGALVGFYFIKKKWMKICIQNCNMQSCNKKDANKSESFSFGSQQS